MDGYVDIDLRFCSTFDINLDGKSFIIVMIFRVAIGYYSQNRNSIFLSKKRNVYFINITPENHSSARSSNWYEKGVFYYACYSFQSTIVGCKPFLFVSICGYKMNSVRIFLSYYRAHYIYIFIFDIFFFSQFLFVWVCKGIKVQ